VVLSVGRGAEVDELLTAFEVVLGVTDADFVEEDAGFVEDADAAEEDILELLERADEDRVVVINVLADELLREELLAVPDDFDAELAVCEADLDAELLVEPPVKFAHGFAYPTSLC
jgi:hypothetical protein